jgi:hypothetical protein
MECAATSYNETVGLVAFGNFFQNDRGIAFVHSLCSKE